MGNPRAATALIRIDLPVVPVQITLEDGEVVRQEMRALVKGDIHSFKPKAIVSYATDQRAGDAEGTGPGMFYALWVMRLLHSCGISCFSGLCVAAGVDWKVFLDKLGGRRSRCDYLIVVQTRAFSTPRRVCRRSTLRCARQRGEAARPRCASFP